MIITIIAGLIWAALFVAAILLLDQMERGERCHICGCKLPAPHRYGTLCSSCQTYIATGPDGRRRILEYFANDANSHERR